MTGRTTLERVTIRRFLPQGEVAKGAGVLVAGTVVAQGLAALSSPILTRLYSPEDFGVAGAFMSLVSLISVIASLRYEVAIPLPDEQLVAANLLAVSLTLVAMVAALVAIPSLLGAEMLTQLLNAPHLKAYLWLLPVAVLAVGTYQGLTYWATRERAFALMARTKVVQGIGLVGTQLGLGFAGAGPYGLLVGYLIGQAGGIGTLLRHTRQTTDPFRYVSLRGMLAAAHRYRGFPLMSSLAVVLNSAADQIPMLFLNGYYGPNIAGLYNLAQQVSSAPMALVGRSVTQAYIGIGARALRSDPLHFRALFWSTLRRLLVPGLGVTALALTAPWVFRVVFGDQWVLSGHFLQIQSVMLGMQFVVAPVTLTLTLMERLDLSLFWNLARCVFVVASFAAAKTMGLGPSAAVAVYAMSTVLMYIAFVLLTAWALRERCNGGAATSA